MGLAALVSCGPKDNGPYPPQGRPWGAKDVDPMLVGHRLMAAGQYELALDAFVRALATQGPSVEAFSSIGTAQLKLGRLNEAEDTLRRALLMDKNFVPAWNNLGCVLMEERKYAEAGVIFQTAFKIDGGQTEAIAENLRLALAKSKNSNYGVTEEGNYKLLRKGSGEYVLETPK